MQKTIASLTKAADHLRATIRLTDASMSWPKRLDHLDADTMAALILVNRAIDDVVAEEVKHYAQSLPPRT